MKTKFFYIKAVFIIAACVLAGCGNTGSGHTEGEDRADIVEIKKDAGEKKDETAVTEQTGLHNETAKDGDIDFEALQKDNPDIFAWLYIPGTEIDYPILQSPESDEYYINHTADGAQGEAGALYTEMPNMMNMCDFNTIIHGKDRKETDLFADLHNFKDPDFFDNNNRFYIYLPDNVLTYEVFAAYYDESSDILRRYDYTAYAGCEQHLQDIFGMRDMGKNLREGWNDLTPYHFLVTLDGEKSETEDRQYVVIGVLISDAAGKIDRVILE